VRLVDVRRSGETASRELRLGGLLIAPLGRTSVVERVFTDLARGRGGWIVTANVDFIQRAAVDADSRAMYAGADLIVADGAPVLWAGRAAGCPLPERVAGSDLVSLLAERAAAEGRSIYLLGGDGDAGRVAEQELVRRWPRLRIAGRDNPMISSPPTEQEVEGLGRRLLETSPDIVYVALGSPKQEQVIDALREQFPACWMMGCGISLSFLSGHVHRAPVWMQRAGLEWMHRVAQEPGRLGRRYLRNIPFAIRLIVTAWSARRASGSDASPEQA